MYLPRVGMVDLDHGAGGAQRLVLRDLLHRQDRAAGDVVLVEDVHRLELCLRHRPLLDAREDLVEPRQPGRRLGVIRMGLPAGLADHVADLLPHRRLGDEIDVGVGIGLPALAFEDAAGLAAAGNRCRRAAPRRRTECLRRTGCIPSTGHGRGAAGRAA